MSLTTLAAEYRASAALLTGRIRELQQELRGCRGTRREQLLLRLNTLQAMYRQTRETAGLLEHYYDR